MIPYRYRISNKNKISALQPRASVSQPDAQPQILSPFGNCLGFNIAAIPALNSTLLPRLAFALTADR